MCLRLYSGRPRILDIDYKFLCIFIPRTFRIKLLSGYWRSKYLLLQSRCPGSCLHQPRVHCRGWDIAEVEQLGTAQSRSQKDLKIPTFWTKRITNSILWQSKLRSQVRWRRWTSREWLPTPGRSSRGRSELRWYTYNQPFTSCLIIMSLSHYILPSWWYL